MGSLNGKDDRDREARRRRGDKAGARKRAALHMESLERRELLANGDGVSQFVPVTNAVADVKGGPLAMAGEHLIGIYLAHQNALAAGQPFRSPYGNLIALRGDKVGVTVSAGSGTVAQLRDALTNLGMDVTATDAKLRLASGFVPIAALPQLVRMPQVVGLLPSYRPVVDRGTVQNDADRGMRADVARSSFNVDGTGVKIGVLSDSVNQFDTPGIPGVGLQESISTGNLPANVQVLQDGLFAGGTDEGRAMLELIYDMAPGASLAFHTADASEVDFANGIRALAQAGSQVIVDDIKYLAEPFFQDGVVAQAVIDVVDNLGVTYFSSAGNYGDGGYSGLFRGANGTVGGTNGRFMDFDPGPGVATTLPISILQNTNIVLQWDNPFYVTNGVTTDLDVLLLDANNAIVGRTTTNNLATGSPVDILFGVGTNATQIALQVAAGTPDPGRVRFVALPGRSLQVSRNFGNDGGNITYGSTFGHVTSDRAIGIGAVPYWVAPAYSAQNPIRNELFSSHGPVPIVFNPDGSRKAQVEVRQSPVVSALDATNTSFFGGDIDTTNPPPGTGPATPTNLDPDTFPNFFGTSAAAPSAAAVAVLMKQLAPNARAADIRAAMIASTLPLNGTAKGTWDPQGGYGLIMADAALQAIDTLRVVTATPGAGQTLTSSPNAVVVTFSRPINPTSLQASDLVFTRVPTGVTLAVGTPSLVNATTVSFPLTVATAPGTKANGTYSYRLADAALTSTDGKPLASYNASFTLADVTNPQVTNTVVLGRVVVVQFSEAMRGATVNAGTVVLERQVAGGWQAINGRTGFVVFYDAPNNRAIIDLTGVDQQFLPGGRYRVTVSDTVTDLVGNRLDGEFNGTFPSGDRKGLPAEDFDNDPFRQEFNAVLRAPQVNSFGLEQSSGPAWANPRIVGTLYNRRAVEVYFSEPMDAASINASTVQLVRLSGANQGFVAGTAVSYDAIGNRAIIDLSRLADSGALTDESYAVNVLPTVRDLAGNRLDGEFNTAASFNVPLGDGLTGRNSLFPSGDGKPVALENADNDQFTQVLPDLATSGASRFVASDSGIAGDQNTNVTRPWFTGNIGSSFPGAVAGLTVLVQFNGPRNGTFDLDVGAGGRGFRGTPDVTTTTDANGNFRFRAPVDLPDGFNTVRLVVVGQPDQPPLPGLSTRFDQSLRIDTTTARVTTTVAQLARLSTLTSLSLDVIDPIVPTSPFNALVVPTQLSLPALDPTSATNISNYSLVNLGADNAPGGTGANADTDLSNFIIGATFVSTTARIQPGDPYTGRIDLSFATGLPSGRYVLTARRPQPGFSGITDAAGNPIDGDPSQPGAQDFALVVDLQPQAAYIKGLKAVSPLNTPNAEPINFADPDTYVTSDPRSFFELSTPGATPRAQAPPTAFFIDFSNPLDPTRDYTDAVRLVRSANSAAAAPDGDFGTDNSFLAGGSGFTRVGGLRVTLVNEIPGAGFGQPGYLNRLRVELPAGTVLPADSYRLFLPNLDNPATPAVDGTAIVDTFGNALDGEFLGNPTATGGFETLMPDGSYRPGLTGDGVPGGAFLTSYVVVPTGNIIYARPDYVDDPFLSQDDPDGSLAKPFPTLAPEAQANALNNGDLNGVANFGTGFDARLDRNQNGRFDRSALFAAQVRSALGPVVVVALPGAQQRDPVTGVTTQATFVLAAPAGGTDPVRNNASASVPYNTTLVFDAGSALKLQNASLFVQNQGSALQALGGFNPEDRVNFTSFSDDAVGGDTNRDGAPGRGGNAPSGGDWGGLVYRNYDQAGRTNLVPFPVDDRLKGPGGADARSGADDGMSILNYANLRYGGGPVPRTLGESNGPVSLFNSRPAVNNARISDSRITNGSVVSGTVGAITADFDSFREDELARGPLVRRVEVINNSINGIYIRAELSGEARQTNAIAYPDNPSAEGGVRNFTIDDPLPHVLTTRLVIGQEELRTTGGQTRSVTNRLYVQPGMMFKMPRGTAIDAVTPGSSINIGDRTYVSQFDRNNLVAPGDPGFRAPTVSDARVLFTSFYDDAATTVFRDPNTGIPTTIVPAIDTDSGGPVNQPTSGNVPLAARWGGLGITSGARVVIDESEFRFGGGIVNIPSGTIGQRDVLRFQGAGGRSLFGSTTGALGTTAYVTNNDFFDNLQAPIGIDPNGLLAADPLRPLSSGNPFFRGNVMTGNDFNGLEVLPALQNFVGYVPNLTVDSTWDDTDLTYVLRGTIRPAGPEGFFGGGGFGGFPTANAGAFDVELRPSLTLTIQSGLPDTVLADGSRIARPGESALVKLLNNAPLAGDGATGFTGPNNTYDSFGGAGFIFGVDDGVDPPADAMLDAGFYTQLRIVGIGGNETTGQQRVPVIMTSLRDDSVGRTVRGVVMNQAIAGNTTAAAPGDGGVIAIGGNTLGDYNLFDPRDGNLIDNADIRYMTRIDLQGGGWVDVGTGGGAGAWKVGATPETQLNSARAITISNSTLSDFSQVGVIAHPSGAQSLQRSPAGGTPTRTPLPNVPAFRGQPVLLYMVNNVVANMPVGVRLNSETVDNGETPSPTEAVFLNNTFYDNPVAIRTQAPDFSGTNSLSHVHFLAMNNIFYGASTAAYQMVGQVRGSQGQFNIYAGGTIPQGLTYQGNFLQFDNVTDIPNASITFRDPDNLDFTLGAGADAVDRARSELGEVNLGLSLAPISDQLLSAVGGIRNATGRTNSIGGIGGPGSVAGPGDIVTINGFPGRTFRDQWIPALPGTPGAVPGPATVGGTFWFLPIGGERDRNGFLRVDDPTVANLGVGSRPFFDIGAYERRIVVPPRVTGVTAIFADATSPTGVRIQNFYSVGGIAGSTQSPLAIQVKFDSRLDPATLNSRTVVLQASGGDGIFGNNNNSADRTIDLSGKLAYDAASQILTVSLAGINPALSNDQFRLTLFGNGSDVIRDPQGNALDAENTAGASPTGAQQALPSGNGIPGGNFFLSFSIDSNPPSVLPGSLRLAPASDTGRPGDNITSSGAPSFTGTIVDVFPPANVLVGQTVFLDFAGPDGTFGTADDRLNAGTALTGPNGVFTVTVGQDGASTGLVPGGLTLPDSNVNVGPDGWLGPNPATGTVDDVLSTYSLARVRVVDQSGNQSSATDTKAQVRFVVDTRGPRITSATPAPGSPVTPAGGNIPIALTFNENVNPASLNSSSIVVVRSGGDGVFGNGNDVPLSVSAGSIVAQPIAGSTAGAMRVAFTVVGATTNDIYRITLLGSGTNAVADWAGNALDGEYGGGFPTGGGGPGGDFPLDIIVLSPNNVSRVLFVDDDAPINPNATGGAGDPFRSIMGQALPGADGKLGTADDVILPGAMGAAGIGDTIAVLPGTYNETVVLKSLVRLVSAGVGSSGGNLIPGQALQTVIRAQVPAAGGTAIGVAATDLLSIGSFATEVSGFTIMVPLSGNTANGPLNTDSIGVSLANADVLLRGNYIINAGTGVLISTNGKSLPASPRLESNGIVGNLNGIAISGTGGSGYADNTPIQVTNNTIAFNTTGMVIVGGPGYVARPIADINNNIFAGNFDGTVARSGAAIYNATQTIANLRANLFSNNGVSQASNADDVAGASLGGAFNPRNLGTTPDANGNFVGNPGFANPRDPRPSPQGQGPAVFFLDANFDLNSVSDAIDNSNGALAPTKDFRSRGRVDIPNRGRAGRGPADIGAFERNGTGGIRGIGGGGAILSSALTSTRSTAGLTARALGTSINTTTAGQAVTIRFTNAVDRSSVQPSDLVLAGALDRVNPARATGLTWIDAQTVQFNLTGAFQPTGEVTVEVPAGAVRSATTGKPMDGYNAVLRPATPPKATTPPAAPVVPPQAAAPTPGTKGPAARRPAGSAWARFLQLRRR
jgi:hypothetical protein